MNEWMKWILYHTKYWDCRDDGDYDAVFKVSLESIDVWILNWLLASVGNSWLHLKIALWKSMGRLKTREFSTSFYNIMYDIDGVVSVDTLWLFVVFSLIIQNYILLLLSYWSDITW